MKVGLAIPQPRGVGVVFDATGRPKIKDGWVERLQPHEREGVDRALRLRGYCLNGSQVEELDNGNSLNGRS